MFEVVSGLKVNLVKRNIFHERVVNDIHVLSIIFGCKVGILPTSYLGLPLGARFNSHQIWVPLLNKIRVRLDSWKA